MPDLRSPRVWLGITWSVFQVYTAYAGLFDLLIQLPVHVAFAVALGFLTTPVPESAAQAEKFRMRRTYRWLDRVADASVAHIVLRTAAATLGIAMLGAGLIGYLRGPTRLWERAVLLVGAFLLIFPGALSDAMGIACFLAVWLAQRDARRRVRRRRLAIVIRGPSRGPPPDEDPGSDAARP